MPDAKHIVKAYAQEILHLRDLLTRMGGLVENQLQLATQAIVEQDSAAGARAVEIDPQVDGLEREAEQFVIRLLALRQPMAQDLREIVAGLKITGDLERIGDYAANVAKRSMVLNQFQLPFSMGGIATMSRLVQENLKLVIDAVGEADAEKANQVWRSDQAIDDLYNGLFRELITYMMEDPRQITPCTHLLFIAKNLERIGDHATNVAETMYYAITGEVLPDARPKGDTSAYAVIRMRDDENRAPRDADQPDMAREA
jgi:phosphate transport system protein